MSLSLIICTNKKIDNSRKLLSTLFLQMDKNDEMILVKDGSKSIIKKSILLKNKKVVLKKCNISNIATLRNIGLRLSTKKTIVFLDDDVMVEKDFLNEVRKSFKQNPEIDGIFPKVKSIGSSIWAKYSEIDYSHWYYKKEITSQVVGFPTSVFAFKRKIIDKKNFFDEELKSGEDIEFTMRLFKQGFKLFYYPKISIKHSFSNTFISFIKKRFWYASNYPLVYKKTNKNYNIDHFLPRRKKELILVYILFLSSYIYLYSRIFSFEEKKSKALVLPTLVDSVVSLVAFYSSRTGRKLFLEKMKHEK